MPSMTMAGTATTPPLVSTRTRLFGNIMRYPPRMPLIAPDAPTVGMPELELNTICGDPAARPQTR
jgi:hypothetical protein